MECHWGRVALKEGGKLTPGVPRRGEQVNCHEGHMNPQGGWTLIPMGGH